MPQQPFAVDVPVLEYKFRRPGGPHLHLVWVLVLVNVVSDSVAWLAYVIGYAYGGLSYLKPAEQHSGLAQQQ